MRRIQERRGRAQRPPKERGARFHRYAIQKGPGRIRRETTRVLGALGMLGGMLGGAGIASCGGAPGAWRATWMVFCAAHWFARTLRRSLAKDGALWALARLVLALVLPSLCASAPFASL